ncbi:MAG TPA: hypothetical protein VK165_20220 [Azonexus sp.]|nr:hypothetical protein [Azonexus sp.]
MSQNTKQQIINGFASRLNDLCDEMGVPPKGRNRQAAMAVLMEVSQKGARKWLEAEGLPTLDKSIQLALWGDVSIEWLLTGRGDKRPTGARSEIALDSSLPALPVDMVRLVGKLAALPAAKRRAIEAVVDAFA